MPRKLLWEFGTHGRAARVYVESWPSTDRQDLVRCEWRANGKRKTESLPDSRDNRRTMRAFAAGTAKRLALKGADEDQRLTMRELGERYVAAHPVGESWRPKTLKTWQQRWRVWVAFVTHERLIDTVTAETLDEFRAALRKQDFAVNQIANHVQMVKSVYRFARERRYLAENPIAEYRMNLSRDQRRLEVPEWTNEECAAILAQLSPKHGRQWRAYVAIQLDALLGGRSAALLGLEWRDVDMDRRTIRWRPELDKLARDREQPLPRAAVRAIRIARVWRARIGYQGPYVLPGARGAEQRAERHYTYQALNYQLQVAAKRAGVRWIPYRAMHGFRRMNLNDVLAATGNLTRAGQWIGDTDMRTLSRSYVRVRADELRDVAEKLDRRNQVATQADGAGGVERQVVE